MVKHNLFNVVFDCILPIYFMTPLMFDYIVSIFTIMHSNSRIVRMIT